MKIIHKLLLELKTGYTVCAMPAKAVFGTVQDTWLVYHIFETT